MLPRVVGTVKSFLDTDVRAQAGGINYLAGAILGVMTAAIVLGLGAYVLVKLKTSLNDTNTNDLFDTVVGGFRDAGDFVGIVLIFIFIGLIIALIRGLGGA